MFKLILDILSNISSGGFVSKVGSRLLNKHSLSGLTIIIMFLEHKHLLPEGSYKVLGTMSVDKLIFYVAFLIGIYFVIKLPDVIDDYSNVSVNKAKNKAELAEYKLREALANAKIKEINKD